jgi:hypothetical protein
MPAMSVGVLVAIATAGEEQGESEGGEQAEE